MVLGQLQHQLLLIPYNLADLIYLTTHRRFLCLETNSLNNYIQEDVNILCKIYILCSGDRTISCVVNLVTMAPKRSTKRQKTTGNALDMSNYLNWPASTLREKLTEANINASPSFPLSVLRKLYADNIIESNADSSSSSLNQQISVQDTENVPSNSVISSESINSNNLATSSDAPSRATSPSTTCLNTTGSESPIIVQSLMNTVQSLQTMVSSLATMVSAKESNPTAQYSLQNYYQSTETTCSPSTSRKFGTNPEDLPQMDLISPSLRKNIVEGKDVNLASLLIPYFEVRPSEKEKEKDDYRLKRNLTISEFLTSFGKYKRVMSHAFPNRREELDMYEANIIDIFNVYGDRFYEYHKLFSLKSASALAIHKIKVDWSARDRDLIQLIASRARTCSICSEVSHDTKFCPSFQKSEVTPFNNTDRHGRKRTSFNGQEICNNFNSSRRCNRSNCPYQHVCTLCKGKDHSAVTCTQSNKTKPKNSTQPSSTQKEDK